MTNPKHNPSGTDSVSSQELKEWHAAGDGVPLQYKGREHVWNKKVAKFAAGGEMYNTVPDMKDGGDIIQGPAFARGGEIRLDKGGAATGVFPQMKPKRSKQDREAAKNVPVDLARGFTAGVLGAPGEIESVIRMLPGLDERTVLPTYEDIEKRLPLRSDTPVSRAATGLGSLAGGFYSGPGAPIRVAGALPGAIKHGAQEFAKASASGAPHVIKPKGGNWLTGSVEKSLESLKRGKAATPEEVAESRAYLDNARATWSPENQRQVDQMEREFGLLRANDALNNWVDRNLTNYVKKEMATPDDPVRKLAEEGISHMPANEIDYANQWLAENLAVARMKAGFSPQDVGVSNTAKGWERLADEMFNIAPASEHTRPLTQSEIGRGIKSTVDDNPWLAKVDPDTPIYYPYNMDTMPRDFGFDHIMDVLREDLAAGRIRPEQLSKVSMTDAVRRTHQYDQELAKKMNESRAAARADLPVYKDYPEGFKWVELNKPGSFANESEAMGHSVRGYEPPKGHPDWVEGSGDRGSLGYGHGGWEAIKSGKAKVYSLVDPKGEPHVTVEVKHPQEVSDELRHKHRDKINERMSDYFIDNPDATHAEALQSVLAGMKNDFPPSITQIKGKQNAAPKADYLPYVQDFVRGGEWSDVGDIHNTGLRNAKNWINPDTMAEYKKHGLEVPNYATEAELDALHSQYEKLANPKGMAHGGAVHMQSGGVAKFLKGAIKAPEIIVPSKLTELKDLILKSEGEYAAKRLERAADEIPNLERMYKPRAIKEAFSGDNAKAVATMRPADFERYAAPLSKKTSVGPKAAELAKNGEIDKHTVTTDEYLKHLQRIKGGFDDVPFLGLMKQEAGLPLMPYIRGHEGRHRSRALADQGETKNLVRILPGSDLREGLPRRSQEEFIDALRQEMEQTGRLVLPEKYFDETAGAIQRPAIELPDLYAKGGEVHMAGAGDVGKAAAKLAAKIFKKEEPIGKLEEVMKAQQAPMAAPHGTGLPLMPRSQGMYTPGVEQKDLPRMPKVDKARAEGKQPAYTERMQDLLDSPTARKKIDKLINKGKDLGMQEWYGTEPLRQVAMDAGLSEEKYREFLAQLASASQRNPVDQQNKMGSYLWHLSQTGQLPEDAFLLTNKIKKDPSLRPEGTPIELPLGYGSLAQGDIFSRGKQIASGDIMGALPPEKKLGTFYRNYLGNLKPVTVDVNAVRGPIIERGDPRWLSSKLVEKDEEGRVIATHFPRKDVAEGRMSLKEAKERPGFWEAAPSGSEYAGFEDLWQRGARRHDVSPAEAQALGWYGSADVTALKTKPELYIDNLERMIKRTAEETGQHPLKVMDDVIKGKGYLYKEGGAVKHKGGLSAATKSCSCND